MVKNLYICIYIHNCYKMGTEKKKKTKRESLKDFISQTWPILKYNPELKNKNLLT